MNSSHPVAIVTGAGSGIGEAVARGLAADGYQLALIARSRGSLEKVASSICSGFHRRLALRRF